MEDSWGEYEVEGEKASSIPEPAEEVEDVRELLESSDRCKGALRWRG